MVCCLAVPSHHLKPCWLAISDATWRPYLLEYQAPSHYSDVIMSAMGSQITGVSIVYSIVCSIADQRKHQSSASLAFVRGIHRWPVNSPYTGPVTRKMFPFDDVILLCLRFTYFKPQSHFSRVNKLRKSGLRILISHFFQHRFIRGKQVHKYSNIHSRSFFSTPSHVFAV